MKKASIGARSEQCRYRHSENVFQERKLQLFQDGYGLPRR